MTASDPTGWIARPRDVAAYVAGRAAAGNPVAIGDARPELKGFWRKTVDSGIYAVLLYPAEEALLGEYLPADVQQRGTCVGRGVYRAVQTGYWDALHARRLVGRAERIAYEPIYAGSRVQIGQGALGNGDGSVGAWAARWCAEFGVIPRGVYEAIDLSKDREDLAVQWGRPGVGVPRSLAARGDAHRCDVYHVTDAADLADVTAAHHASAICSTHRQSNTRDGNGECLYAGSTSHCEAIVGVYLRATWDGRPETVYDHTGFVDQQSWGNTPGGSDVLRFHQGSAKLRQGAYGTPMPAVRLRIVTGETWAFRLHEGFVSPTLRETLQ